MVLHLRVIKVKQLLKMASFAIRLSYVALAARLGARCGAACRPGCLGCAPALCPPIAVRGPCRHQLALGILLSALELELLDHTAFRFDAAVQCGTSKRKLGVVEVVLVGERVSYRRYVRVLQCCHNAQAGRKRIRRSKVRCSRKAAENVGHCFGRKKKIRKRARCAAGVEEKTDCPSRCWVVVNMKRRCAYDAGKD